MKRILFCLLLLPTYTAFSMEEKGEKEAVIIDLEVGENANDISREQWTEQLKASIQHGKGKDFLTLLAPEGLPKDRGMFSGFKPYDDALEAIDSHRERERRILTNQAFEDSKFQCCNGTYVWNRFCKPVVLGGAKLLQISASLWGIISAVTNPAVLTSDLEKVITNTTAIQELINNANNSAVTNAGPDIVTLIAAAVVIPFTAKSAYHAFIMKKQRSKFEWYTIAKKLVELQDEIEKTVKENNKKLDKLLNEKEEEK